MDENKSTHLFHLSLVCWFAAGVAIAVMYVFSIGPACWLMFHGYLHEEIYATVYFPLFKAAETVSPLGDFLVFWVDWWVPVEDVIQSVKVFT